MKTVIKNKPQTEVTPRFCWVVALRSEAKPLIEMFSMKILSNQLLFPIYINEGNGHALVISGVGQVKSAAAATFLRERLAVSDFAAWINLGIAGCFKGPVGSIHQALKVVGKNSGKSFFPGTSFRKIVDGTSLVTVAEPETRYSSTCLYDMEAAGFCEIVPFFSCNELTYVFKIVSDTLEAPQVVIDKNFVTSLVKKNTDIIFALVEAINDLVKDEENRLKIPNEIQNALSSYHFTETNRARFLRIYKNWRCIFPSRSLINYNKPPHTASDLIRKLENDLSVEAQNWKLK